MSPALPALLAVMLVAACHPAAASSSLPSQETIAGCAKAAADAYFTQNPIAKEGCGWTSGALFAGVSNWMAATDNATAAARAEEWSSKDGWVSCGLPSVKDATDANNELQGDTYAFLAQRDSNTSHINSIRSVLDIQVGREEVGDWFWVDAVFMSMPTFAHVASVVSSSPALRLEGNPPSAYLAKALAIFNDTANGIGLWSAEYSLFYRDATFLNSTAPNGKPVFWGRGNGWAFAALARTLQLLPPDADDAASATLRDTLTPYFTAMASSLAALQGSDGMWRSSLLDADQYSNPETTSSAAFVYGYAWGVKHGLLPADKFMPVLVNGWHGLQTIAQQSNGTVGWCQGVGAKPGPATADSTSNFCTGLFLLAASEAWKLAAP